jgi:hypothetical protein
MLLPVGGTRGAAHESSQDRACGVDCDAAAQHGELRIPVRFKWALCFLVGGGRGAPFGALGQCDERRFIEVEQVTPQLKLKQEDCEHEHKHKHKQEQEHGFKQQDGGYQQEQDGCEEHLWHFVESEAGLIQGRAHLHGEEGRHALRDRGAQWHQRGQDQGGERSQL